MFSFLFSQKILQMLFKNPKHNSIFVKNPRKEHQIYIYVCLYMYICMYVCYIYTYIYYTYKKIEHDLDKDFKI